MPSSSFLDFFITDWIVAIITLVFVGAVILVAAAVEAGHRAADRIWAHLINADTEQD